MATIEIFKVDYHRWDEIVMTFPNFDVYYLNGYVRPFMLHGDGEPNLLYYDGGGLRAIYVFMKRSIDDTYFDINTPYGYGGVLFDGSVTQQTLEDFKIRFIQKMIEERIVDNFVRYHPVLCNSEPMRLISSVTDLGKTVSMDLSSHEEIWDNITCKNKIRKALKNDVVIKNGKSLRLFEYFNHVYSQTMNNDRADRYYYFNESFFTELHHSLYDNYEMFYATIDNKIVSMAIIIFANKKMHYHLSGTLFDFRKFAPVNLLLYKAACWGCEQGYESFHLGGGLGSGEDSLYKFKSGFNRNSEHQFSVGKEIFDRKVYEELVSARGIGDDLFDLSSEYFPLYRMG